MRLAQRAVWGRVEMAAPIAFTGFASAYTENFDTLSNAPGSTTNNLVLPGFEISEAGGGSRVNEHYAVDDGTSQCAAPIVGFRIFFGRDPCLPPPIPDRQTP
jgi:hypothetical protein